MEDNLGISLALIGLREHLKKLAVISRICLKLKYDWSLLTNFDVQIIVQLYKVFRQMASG
jgi:hypothetical protein